MIMKNEKNFFKKPTQKQKYMLTFLVSIALITILISIFLNANLNEKMSNLISGLAVSILSSMIFLVLTEFIFDDKKNVKKIKRNISKIFQTITISEDIKNYGIKSIKNISYGVESDFWTKLLNSSEEKLYIMAHTLSPWFQEEYEKVFFNTLRKMVSNKKEIRIVILMPNADNLKYMNIGSVDDYSRRISSTIKRLESFYFNLKPDEKSFFL